jgi:uncharacterized integral membrane protein
MKLCRSCGRLLDDYTRFCDRCGLVQPLQPAAQTQYQYLQPPQPIQLFPELAQPRPPIVSPVRPPRPEAEAGVTPSHPAVEATRWPLRPLGRKLNYVGILGGILALASLVMPWWTATATVPVIGLGNSTAIDFPLYLYKASANVLASPPRIVTLDLWFCWATLALAALAALWAIVGSAVSGRGKWMLVIGGVIALISIIVFAVGLQNELSRTGSGLDLFEMVSSSWGTFTTYLSFGFWAALVAAATMLGAARRRMPRSPGT